ncbi:DUF2848 domain-containing protein [Stappia sp.]|uniref:DUF2848 domain-containing protein n=1 Tax=Stappia sp. TaxID=1870903 RepID=UPI0032D91AB6
MQFTANDVPLPARLDALTVAGWTGRNEDTIRHHIEELAALGVTPPSAVPLYYRVATDLLTFADAIQVVGEGTSGEVEPLLVTTGGRLYLGLASDHTDRDLETHSVALSKQACAKPAAKTLWPFAEVEDHLEALELRSWIRETPEAEWTLYQEGTLASIRPLDELIEASGLEAARAGGTTAAMLCGTLGAIGGVRPAAAFRMEMRDPVLDRTLSHGYQIETLPIVA